MEKANRPIPNRLKVHRRLRGYKQKEVALLLGLSGALQLRQWEQGKSFPNMPNLVKLSILYRTYLNDLYPTYFKEAKVFLDARELKFFESNILYP
jgi:transcriptional regulator with XRE-family HTH domain